MRDRIDWPYSHRNFCILISGIFPISLKIAKIICIFKKCGRCDVNSYRPVSILPTSVEFLEKIVLDQIYHHFTVSNLFNASLFRFRKQLLTENAVLGLSDHILGKFDNGGYTVATHFHKSTAFDTLDRSIRIRKLRC